MLVGVGHIQQMHIRNELILIGIEDFGHQALEVLLAKAIECLAWDDGVRIVRQVPNAFLELVAEAQNRGNFVVFGLKLSEISGGKSAKISLQ